MDANARHSNRLTVFEPLRLVSCTRVGRRLRVVVLDQFRRDHVLVFRSPNESHARSHLSVMEQWFWNGARLAYVRGRRSAALVDIDALFARAI
jgi:hypothetical protein